MAKYIIIFCSIFIILGLIYEYCYPQKLPSSEVIANAIYKAEGGAKTNHPYGILKTYIHTPPRQACINTIDHAKRDWDGKGDFIEFLGSRYCPVGAKNDPTGLNKNWVKNVKWFLAHDSKEVKHE
jgi:hypothetical protein